MSDTDTGYVYTLNDPRTGEPKYVGATVQPEDRLYQHIHGNTNGDVKQWIEDLETHGEKPVMNIVRTAPIDELSDKEVEIIETLANEWDLFNKQRTGGYSGGRPKDHESDGPKPKVRVPQPVYDKAKEHAAEKDSTIGEAIRHMCQEGGYDV